MLKHFFIFGLVSMLVMPSYASYNMEHITPCNDNIFCLNGGTCYITKFMLHNSNTGIKLCFCPVNFTGYRCQYIKNKDIGI
ncbi:Secreted EGF-like growth factor [Eptesipox virus]|uniref:Secreted EGF-like growth factor n=1 Tax=Eptesipox virus TaxID=1329402 RepID=A0A220T677_9POXV|nr:Secreted EGF-like growth factor [Eptesipox virus]ASK51216.1 Secreted EGF-like growth factor [Eptesipox virus]WAH70974.1 secreted EGF-like growth factor [Eptesipox virus]